MARFFPTKKNVSESAFYLAEFSGSDTVYLSVGIDVRRVGRESLRKRVTCPRKPQRRRQNMLAASRSVGVRIPRPAKFGMSNKGESYELHERAQSGCVPQQYGLHGHWRPCSICRRASNIALDPLSAGQEPKKTAQGLLGLEAVRDWPWIPARALHFQLNKRRKGERK